MLKKLSTTVRLPRVTQWRRYTIPLTVDFICFLFIILFIYAAGNKLFDYEKFTIQLGQSPMVTRWAGFVAWFIPATEISIAILLTIKRTQKAALYAAFNLMVAFTVYIFIVTHFYAHVPCSCGGVLERLSWTEHLYFNIGFVFLAMLALVLHDHIKAAP